MTDVSISISNSDIDALTRIAYAEAHSINDYYIRNGLSAAEAGKLAYGSIVDSILNRVAAGLFNETTIQGTINHSSQYEPITKAGGNWQNLPIPSIEVRTIVENHIMARTQGEASIVGSATHYLNPTVGYTAPAWNGTGTSQGWGVSMQDKTIIGAFSYGDNGTLANNRFTHTFGNPLADAKPKSYLLSYGTNSYSFDESGLSRSFVRNNGMSVELMRYFGGNSAVEYVSLSANGPKYIIGGAASLEAIMGSNLSNISSIPGNEWLSDRIFTDGQNTFVGFGQSDVFKTNVNSSSYDYKILLNGVLSYDSNVNQITTPANNLWMDNHTDFKQQAGNHTNSNASPVFLNGVAADGGNWSLNMPGSVLNGNGFQNVAAASTLTDDLMPGAGIIASSDVFLQSAGNIWNNVVNGSLSLSSTFLTGGLPQGGSYTSFIQQAANVTKSSVFLQNVDPVVLDLDGDGVELIAYQDSIATFDVDNDNYIENTGWVGSDDGILVHDRNNDGKINNITETISEYYGAASGAGAIYTDGLKALKTLDSNNDNVFNSSDAMYSTLRVWKDGNADGRTDAGELKTLAELGITSINLNSQTVKREEVAGNPVLSRTTMTMNGQTRDVASVDFATNPIGYEWNQVSDGVKLTSDDGTSSTYAIGSTTGSTANFATLNVKSVIGNVGNDTIIGDATDNWMIGGAGNDSMSGGAGNDVLIIDADDNLANINAGDGLDTVQVSDTRGVTINLHNINAEVVIGGDGNDTFIGGGNTNVFIRGGKGDDAIIGGSADDALSGEDGNDTMDGGRGDDVIRGHRGKDVLIGNLGEDLLFGGDDDDKIYGDAGEDLLNGGSGNDMLYGGADYDVAEFTGNLDQYVVTHLSDGTVRVTDKVAGRDGTDILKDIEALNFKNIKEVQLDLPNPFTSNDVVSVSGTGPYTISAASILANDIDYQGNPLHITGITDVVGGSAVLSGSNIIFTPNASYQGVLSFKYTIADSLNNAGAQAVVIATGQAAEMKGTVSIRQDGQPIDPLFYEQWYLSDANILPVWKDYTGAGVKVGVFDLGFVDVNHSDLVNNLSQDTIDGVVRSQIAEHATLVAGVIGATKNNLGSIGVAYDATISSIAVGQGDNINLNVIYDYKNYDIVNNSWGFTAPFVDNFIANPQNEQPFIDAASLGRNGLGTIIINSAGNERQEGGNANTSNFDNNRFGITVGAINKNADLGSLEISQKPFSNAGANLLISAPGSNITSTSLIIENSNGSIFGDNYEVTEGTSFATPIIAGITALMLEANPDLGYRDVQEILAYSARNVLDSSTSWQENGANNWNGRGLHFSHDYGFGNVDALAAVRLAETWTQQQTFENEVQGSITKTVTGGTLSSSSIFTDTVNFNTTQQMVAEHVEVRLNLQHSRIGDLVVTLTSPDGTNSILLNRLDKAPSDAADLGHGAGDFTYTYGSTANWGENPNGTWTLKIEDKVTGEVGVLRDWKLSVYGDVASANSNYIYTNEFAGITSTAAKNLADTSGDDTINTAAVTGNVSINLASGANSTIAGNTLTMGSTTVIERVFTGDGNDTLLGNSSNNLLYSGRGNDTLDGKDGNDWLVGKSGNDILTGGSGSDRFVIIKGDTGSKDIQDFNLGSDFLVIAGYGALKFADLTVTQVGANSHITLSDGQQIILRNITASSLTSSSVVFQEEFSISDLVLSKFEYMGTDNSDAQYIYSGSLPSLMYGKGGDDTIWGGTGDDEIYGGTGNDILIGSPNSTSDAGNGKDVLYGEEGDDQLYGAGDNDKLYGGLGNDRLQGYAGNDLLAGGTGYNTLYGEEGNDTFYLEGGLNTVFGDSSGTANLNGNTGNDTFVIFKDTENDGSLTASLSGINIGGFNDIIYDFSTTKDVIDITRFVGTNSFSDLTFGNFNLNGHIYTKVFIDGSASTQHVTLYNVQSSQLSAANFIFQDNEAPTLVSDSLSTNEDTPLTFNTSVLTNNDTDLEDGTPSFSRIINNPQHGTITHDSNGNYTYTPDANYSGTDTFTYEAKDSDGASSTSLVTINVGSVNDAASGALVASSLKIKTGTPFSFLPNFTDVDGDVLSYQVTLQNGQPLPSWLQFDATTGRLYSSASPTAPANLIVKFTVSDGTTSINQDMSISVETRNPIAVTDSISSNEDQIVNGNVLSNNGNGVDSDPDGDSIVVEAGTFTTTQGGTVVISSNGSFIYTPLANFNGTDSFNYKITDSNNAIATGLVNIAVAAVQDAPVAKNDIFTSGVNVALTGNVLNNNGNGVDTDIDGDVLSVIAGTFATVAGGSVTILANGNFSYTPALNFTGADSFNYTLSDGSSSTGGVANITISSVINGTSIGETINGTNAADVIYAGAGNDNIIGMDGNDTIYGEDGNDTLNGGSGNDTLTGGNGDDIYVIDSVSDVVVESANQGIDTVQSSITYALGANVENLTLTGTSSINATGNNVSNTINGNSGNNTISGAGGYDVIQAGAGDDIINFTQSQHLNDLTTAGYSQSNLIKGQEGFDRLNLYYTSSEFTSDVKTDILEFTAFLANSSNNNTSQATGSDFYFDTSKINVSRIEAMSFYVDNVQTNVFVDAKDDHFSTQTSTALTGNLFVNNGNGIDTAFASTIYAVAGTYTTSGGGTIVISANGNFTYTPVSAYQGVDTVTYQINDGYGTSDTAQINISVGTVPIIGTSGNDTLTGTTSNDTIYGQAGNDTINGGVGADAMYGGTGDDTYIVDSVSDTANELSAEGTDTVQSSVTYTLSVNTENLTLTGISAINGIGNTLDNVLVGNSANNTLTGNAGNDTLDGGAGNDTLIGGTGNDTYIMDSASDIIVENANEGIDLVLMSVSNSGGMGNIENITLTGTGNINILANALDNILIGNAGNNQFNGYLGEDTMIGGLGNDMYRVNSIGDTITEYTNEGTDTAMVEADFGYILSANVENLSLLNTALIGKGNELNNSISGNNSNNTLSGYDGNDTLDGQGGADTMYGGAGNDTYYYRDAGDIIVENANEGIDSIYAYINMSTLNTNVENLYLGVSANTGTGNSLNNTIIANGILDSTLYGMDGNDTLMGGNKNDILVGGNGLDILQGQAGADTFLFELASAFNNIDVINDFNISQGDKIDIKDLIPTYDPLVHTLSNFVNVLNAPANSSSFLQIDRDGSGTAYGFQTVAQIVGAPTLANATTLASGGSLIVH